MNGAHLRFWLFSCLACASAALPFIPTSNGTLWLFQMFGAPALWMAAFWGATRANRQIGVHQWCLWLAVPFAFRYLAQLIAMVVFGVVTGDRL